MNKICIQVENLNKKYQLGEIGTGKLSVDIENWIKKKILHNKLNGNAKNNTTNEFWALQNISFQVNKGDVLGIIGANGAGKSTLLKILSKITKPTSGSVYLDGKVSSLLEVGTGFHPELTGKENIYMNGAILGMNKREISDQLESIIAFSGIENHINTPIKRYSTGMKVRLGFAVAAHLKQEILIVDEVLAVGDAEFQQKCLGSMQNLRNEGRTVLFVSHNMAAIKQLCNRTIVLSRGKIIENATPEVGIIAYLDSLKPPKKETDSSFFINEDETISYNQILIKQLDREVTQLNNDAAIDIEVCFSIKQKTHGFRLILLLYDKFDILISKSFFDEINDMGSYITPGNYLCNFSLPPNILIEGKYKIVITAGIHNVRMCKPTEGISMAFNVIETGLIKRKRFSESDRGLVTLPFKIETKII